ncbi:MAG: NADP-dependent oxidoreductase [Candidatus Nitrosopolaris sp.]
MVVTHEIRLKERPVGMPTNENFELVEVQIPEPRDGEFLVRNIWMSVDPYMRGRMTERKSYVPPFELGKVLEGGCVGKVVESKNNQFAVADYALGMNGWREYWISEGNPASGVSKIDPNMGPIQLFLGIFGMTGLTAYVGFLSIGQLKEGESVFVSAASGAVGSVVCQIAKAKGCYVVGSAGSKEKVSWLINNVGIDHAFNYKELMDDTISTELRKAYSHHSSEEEGIDLYFDNVGGKHLEAALDNMKVFGRIVLCGMISQYNDTSPTLGPANIFLGITKRLRLQGFIVRDHYDVINKFLDDMAKWVKEGKIKWKETVFEGLENSSKAFIARFNGENFGKTLVKIGPDS